MYRFGCHCFVALCMSTDSLKVLARARINSRPLSRKRKVRGNIASVPLGIESNETVQNDESALSGMPRERVASDTGYGLLLISSKTYLVNRKVGGRHLENL